MRAFVRAAPSQQNARAGEMERQPPLPGDELSKLLDSAEYGCFIGASLTATPSYEWRVNGESVR